ncbi:MULTISPECIES: carbamoyltransferase C-terminal domain-containing protein [unclassified Rhizobacter]|uniref:carbamoyltransferase family protein n=1 Tax=unclassified Rhizobacter TaxID=2640088 RepID=UPI0006FBAD20|nr:MULTISPECIES: carbamoyltransferase C-terminal domain-containing protein [unclassified Rhizobacter]KQU66206.1 carbamoyltransferase [Rhizobacter sp. Root29]KQV97976.1 carbamoyltransferase [Rhizobacter sp. Root1238]KRB19092.1 carbamoyltransferase [Rhizobacter sp. Root16D2]
MITLGLNAAFHDSAAALVVDGIVVAAAEEERFTRIKHGKRPVPFSAWELPYHAIDFCLRQSGVTLRDVDHVAYSYDPEHFLGDRPADRLTLPMQPSLAPSGEWENPWDPLFAAYIVNAPRQLADGAPHHLRRRLAGVRADDAPYRWHFVNHHVCHQASAFLAAPFARCAVMTLDGRGEHATTTYGRHRDSRYEPLGEVLMPSSLGMLYEQVTTHLGFLHSSDEYKVMALAALGTPRYAGALREHVHIGRNGVYAVAPIDLHALVGPKREAGSELAERDLDLAASLQDVLEDTVLALAGWLREASGERQLAMAGGVALNCVMNTRLRDSGIFDSVWVQPAAGDAGTALGAALWTDARERRGLAPEQSDDPALQQINTMAPRRWQMDHVYLGPGYEDDEIEALLTWAKLPYRRSDALAEEVARLLADNRIVGWFQGRMEFGPRSLGARSILASPITPQMQARLNELKDREDFRPVAPAIPVEDLPQWFAPAEANGGRSPFMLFTYDVLPRQRDRIPSACHTDRTARVQTVDRDTNPRFHALLKAFGELTGVPVLVNTSFNVRGEPIVCTPRAAIEAFYSTSLDALAIGSFIVEKG